MLDHGMLEQLKSVFAGLENQIILQVYSSHHSDQQTLLEMLHSLAGASSKIEVELLNEAKPTPLFSISKKGQAPKLYFRGVPGGHEFSSLVLSILYTDGKGKQPDSGVIQRIRNIKGPVRLQTYISLSCENCPDVVQNLNLIASLHDDFHHEMVDGAHASDEISQLGIQSVPSITHDNKVIHAGKIQLLDLLELLEKIFGKQANPQQQVKLGRFEVVIIGGGPAGVSAAIYTARKGLKTALVAERLGGQLQETKGIENMISVPYTQGVQLAQELHKHLSQYPVEVFTHRRVREIIPGPLKHTQLESGEELESEAVIIASGTRWRELGIPGERQYIGMGVAFCAHCDGPFYKGKRVAVIGGGNSGVEAALDLSHLAEHVTLLEFTDTLKADRVLIEKLSQTHHIQVITSARSTQIIGDGKKVHTLEYENTQTKKLNALQVDGVFVQIGLIPNSSFVKSIIETTKYGEIIVDSKGRSSSAGIYAAGDVTTIPFKQIITAMGDGAKVALSVFEDRMRTHSSAQDQQPE